MKLNTKRFALIFLSIFFFTITSCSKEELNEDVVTSHSKTHTNSYLSFSSVEELEKTINSLLKMNQKDLEEWYTSKDFFSVQQLYDDAITKLDQIKDLQGVAAYKKHYSDYFIFDNNKTDINATPYLKISKYAYSFVCNIQGGVIINGEICNYNDLTSFEETVYYKNEQLKTKKSPSVNSKDNYLSLSYGDRRFRVESRRVGDDVYLEFFAEKRTMWWSKYSTSYTIHHEYNNEAWTYVSQSNPSQFGLLYLVGPRDINNPSVKYPYTTPELGPNERLFFDRRKAINSPDGSVIYPKAQAKVQISSRGTAGNVGGLEVLPNLL